MKRFVCVFLVIALLLSGCSFFGDRIREPVTFHYLCSDYQEKLCCVIVPEERESSGHTGELSYLLALYQMGPANEEYRSPLPFGTRISANVTEGQIILKLSDEALILSDLEYALACACLTLTCLDIVEAESVTVSCGERSKTMSRSSLTLYDETETESLTEEKQ